MRSVRGLSTLRRDLSYSHTTGHLGLVVLMVIVQFLFYTSTVRLVSRFPAKALCKTSICNLDRHANMNLFLYSVIFLCPLSIRGVARGTTRAIIRRDKSAVDLLQTEKVRLASKNRSIKNYENKDRLIDLPKALQRSTAKSQRYRVIDRASYQRRGGRRIRPRCRRLRDRRRRS